MAVTVTVAGLMAALRMGNSDLEKAEATRLLAVSGELVASFAPYAPDAVQDEAAIRCAGFLYDVPYGGSSMVQNPLRLSGASAILARYRRLRAGKIFDPGIEEEPMGRRTLAHIVAGPDPVDISRGLAPGRYVAQVRPNLSGARALVAYGPTPPSDAADWWAYVNLDTFEFEGGVSCWVRSSSDDQVTVARRWDG